MMKGYVATSIYVPKPLLEKVDLLSKHFVATGAAEMTRSEIIRKAITHYTNIVCRNVVKETDDDR